MNKAQLLFLADYSSTPISLDYSPISYTEFWERVLDPAHNVNLTFNEHADGIHRASYFHDGYIYIYYSFKGSKDQLSDDDTFACRYTDDNMPVPGDFVDGYMYGE